MFFVSGLTGHVGGAAAKQLLSDGHHVRTLARDPQKAADWAQQGVEVRQGDFNDSAALASALEGVEGAFLMVPPTLTPDPNFSEVKAMIASFQTALKQSPPPRLVVLSSVGSEKSSGLGLITSTHLLEVGLGEFSFPTAFVRAGGFLENHLPSFKIAASSGWFDTFYTPTDKPLTSIATEDIGKEVAHLLSTDWSGHRFIELGSLVSADELASAMSEAAGRTIQARSIPRDQWSNVLQGMGLPPDATGPYEEMADSFNSGWIAFGAPGTEPVAATITPREFFQRAKDAL